MGSFVSTTWSAQNGLPGPVLLSISSSLPSRGSSWVARHDPPSIPSLPWPSILSTVIVRAEGRRAATLPQMKTYKSPASNAGHQLLKGTSQCRNHCTIIPHPVTPLTRSLPACQLAQGGCVRGLAPLRGEGTRRRGGKGRCLLPFLGCSSPSGLLSVDMPDVPVAAVPVSAARCLAVAPLACGRHLRARWWLDDGRWQVVGGHPIRSLPKPLTAGLVGERKSGWMPVR